LFSGFGAVLDKLQGLLGKAYLLAGFLPVLVFALLSLLASVVVLEPARRLLDGVLTLTTTWQVLGGGLSIVVLAIGGFLFWSLNPWLRRVLEGDVLLPRWARQWFESRQQAHLKSLERKIADLRVEVYDYRRVHKMSHNWAKQLNAARSRGLASTQAPDKGVMDCAKNTVNKLESLRDKHQRLPFHDVEKLFSKVKRLLESASADTHTALDQLHRALVPLYDYGWEACENEYGIRVAERQFKYPQETALAPTDLGNAARLHRDYAWSRFGMDIDVFWLRMQKLVTADEHFGPIIETAKLQLDVAVAMTAMLGTWTICWSTIVALRTNTLGLYAVVALAGSLLTMIFYGVAVQHFRTFSEVVRSAVDLFRFALLKELHIPLPADSNEEKQVWERLTNQYWLSDQTRIVYKHE
jgi:hypothetical protein